MNGPVDKLFAARVMQGGCSLVSPLPFLPPTDQVIDKVDIAEGNDDGQNLVDREEWR